MPSQRRRQPHPQARRLCLSFSFSRDAFSRLLGTIEIGVRLILGLDLCGLCILGTCVELGIRFLLGGITVSLSLLTDRGIQLTLLHGNLALGEFDLLGLSRDLRLLLCDIEFTLLFSRHGLLDLFNTLITSTYAINVLKRPSEPLRRNSRQLAKTSYFTYPYIVACGLKNFRDFQKQAER